MNLREGRIGRQEAAALAVIVCVVAGLFGYDPVLTYAHGNSLYLATALAAGLSLLLFLLVAEAMRRQNCANLAALYRVAFGNVLAAPMALLTVLAMLAAGAMPLYRLFDTLARYVYMSVQPWTVLLYALPPVLLLCWMGLEATGRTARLFLWVMVFSVLGAVLTAAPVYETARLYPLVGDGLPNMLRTGAACIAQYFPALLALLACGRGVHGTENAASAATVAAGGGAVLTGGASLCLGMTYPSELLRTMRAPMFLMSMSIPSGSAYQRIDKLLLFLWTLSGLIGAGFLGYSSALLYTEAAGLEDVRPAAVASGMTVCVLALLGLVRPAWVGRAAALLTDFLWLALVLPPMLAAAVASLKGGRAS